MHGELLQSRWLVHAEPALQGRTWGSAAGSKERKGACCCAEPTWLGSSASAQRAHLLPTSLQSYKMVPQAGPSSLQPHVSLLRGKARGYGQLNSPSLGLQLFSPLSSPRLGQTFYR